MSVQSDCNNISTVKTELRKAIQSNNGELTINDDFEVYPTAINNMIPGPKQVDITGLSGYIMDDNLIITIPDTVTKLRDYAFSNDTLFIGINLLSQEVVTLGKHVFKGTNIENGTGRIYVPASLVDTYKNTEGWSQYSTQIESVANLPSARVIHNVETLDEHRTIAYLNRTKVENFFN